MTPALALCIYDESGRALQALSGSGLCGSAAITLKGVRVQLVTSDAACFESVFPAPAEVDEATAFEDAIR